MGAYADEKVVAALRLLRKHDGDWATAEQEAQHRMDEAEHCSSSEWLKWLIVRDSLHAGTGP